MGLKVTKASGVLEDFNPDKLKASIQRAGADAELADMDTERIQSLLSLPLRKAEALKRQAESICLC